MDDDALEVPDDRLLVVAQFDRERAAEPVGDVSHRLRRLPGVVWEDHPVGAERSGREPNVRRHAVVAARPVAVPEDDDLARIVHTGGAPASGVVLSMRASRGRPPRRQAFRRV